MTWLWLRLALWLGTSLTALALLCLGTGAAVADVADDEVDLSVSLEARPFTNDLGMTLVPVRRGSFLMGAPANEKERQNDEPQHRVEITKDFFLGATEVTQKQYAAVMGKNPAHFSKTGQGAGAVVGLDTDDFPVESVNYQDATAFVEKLNARDRRKSGWKYALPTEAQWEYACRGGPDATLKPIRFAKAQDSISGDEANFQSTTPYNGGKPGQPLNRTCKVASYRPNNLGLYDMHGNVWEYCRDKYATDYGGTNVLRDPTGPAKGDQYVIKSCGYYNVGWECRAARRFPYNSRDGGVGFRVAFVQER